MPPENAAFEGQRQVRGVTSTNPEIKNHLGLSRKNFGLLSI